VSSTAPNTLEHDQNRDRDRSHHAEFLLASLRSLPDAEVHELLQHIRKDARIDTATLAESWRKATALSSTTPIEPQLLDRDLSMLLGKPATTPAGDGRFFGHTSTLSLASDEEPYMTHARKLAAQAAEDRTSGTWTAVTQDVAFVERLLQLYFRWSHTYVCSFSASVRCDCKTWRDFAKA
jgi:hypothetical protein